MSRPDFTADAAAFQAKLREVFEQGVNLGVKQGVEQGAREERARIGRGLLAGDPAAIEARDSDNDIGEGVTSPTKRGRRMPPGTIRPIVQDVVNTEPGLTKAEITRQVVARNPNIAASSISNELTRNEKNERRGAKIYRRTRGRWYPHHEQELPATEGPAVAEDDRPAGSILNGSHTDERSITASGSGE